METSKAIKVVFIGDGATGKTCFLIVAVSSVFPKGYIPTVFDHYTKDVDFNGSKHKLFFVDTAGGLNLHFD